jgi:hypothetical protein
MRSFRDFYENKVRLAMKHLNILSKALEHSGFKVDSFLNEQFEEPYVFVYNPNSNTSFQGVRLYKIGDKIAYRIQRENQTHPYGNAYSLEVELMYDDLVEEGEDPKHVGPKVMEMIAKEFKAFFDESAKAEKDRNFTDQNKDNDALGSVHIRNPLGGDYSSMVHDDKH